MSHLLWKRLQFPTTYHYHQKNMKENSILHFHRVECAELLSWVNEESGKNLFAQFDFNFLTFSNGIVTAITLNGTTKTL